MAGAPARRLGHGAVAIVCDPAVPAVHHGRRLPRHRPGQLPDIHAAKAAALHDERRRLPATSLLAHRAISATPAATRARISVRPPIASAVTTAPINAPDPPSPPPRPRHPTASHRGLPVGPYRQEGFLVRRCCSRGRSRPALLLSFRHPCPASQRRPTVTGVVQTQRAWCQAAVAAEPSNESGADDDDRRQRPVPLLAVRSATTVVDAAGFPGRRTSGWLGVGQTVDVPSAVPQRVIIWLRRRRRDAYRRGRTDGSGRRVPQEWTLRSTAAATSIWRCAERLIRNAQQRYSPRRRPCPAHRHFRRRPRNLATPSSWTD